MRLGMVKSQGADCFSLLKRTKFCLWLLRGASSKLGWSEASKAGMRASCVKLRRQASMTFRAGFTLPVDHSL